ncbi:MAG: hypothetical protein AB7P16_28660 [Bradyrhizobium sp.]|uniref:hypothetical protein n=1 Tax=Bradyrhizobium sp. TaxID=376 RepID=UPI003D0E4F41
MAVVLSSLKTDLRAETEGAWEDAVGLPGVRLRVRSLSYPPYMTARDLLSQQFVRDYGTQPVPSNVMTPAIGTLFAEHILLEWTGLDVPYDPEVARETLANPEYRVMVAAIEAAASRVGRGQIKFVETAKGNSEQPSATS